QSPINAEIMRHATKGTPILGICNGFQVLCEAGLLPGTLLRNNSLKYICKDVELVVTNQDTIFTKAFKGKPNPIMTVGNGEGNYFADQETLNKLHGENLIAFKYVDTPNGSLEDIAGIINEKGNVLGLMPHPDRAFAKELGSDDGALIFRSLLG
ncbi:MAG: phosphoribosylformylglycinamidine synthase subunit PurQ, partial [Caulobacterales bacterium]|nr:phosphoribosylformylglycinamidine synthase subunit PurQ [Caulobacterales bacterium]